MSNKKHIDRVFQEKLKDFEVSPSPKVWQNIKGELEQPDQNRKVFPLWLRLAGVAAILLLLFTVGNEIISKGGDSNNNQVVDTENTKNTSNNNSSTDDLNNNNRVDNLQNASQNEGLTNQNESLTDVNLLDLNSATDNDATKNTKVATTNPTELNTNSLNNNSVAESNSSNKTGSSSNKKSSFEDKNKDYLTSTKNSKTNTESTNAVAQKNNLGHTDQTSQGIAQNKKSLNTSSENENKRNAPNNSRVSSTPTITEGIAQNNPPSNIDSEKANTSSLYKDANNNGVSSTPAMTESVAQNNNSEKQNSNSSAIPELDKIKADAALKNSSKDALAENQSNSEIEGLEEQENQTTDEESDEDSPSIEEEIAKAEDIIEEEEIVDRWQVYANVAPVYYNTLGKGSHIDDQFVQNSKSGETNTSYGVNVSYVLSKKLKLRSGLNALDLSYDTDNVILYENVGNNTSSSPRNLDLTTTGQSFSAISATNLGAQQLSNVIGGNANAAISQRIAYYEVPLELEYNLVDKKFGVNVIGGFSTFILNDNKVYSEFEGYKTEVGEANNINNVSFSGNLGLGLDYKFSDKIKLNVQPTFKYQLNAYKNTSGNFRPYIVGVYTGLSYKF